MTAVCYTFRRCPYAIRARMALDYAGIEPEYREIVFSNKPPSMLQASPKGTVPVLIEEDGHVIEESWDIMLWALAQNDPDNWLGNGKEFLEQASQLVNTNDFDFKNHLNRYKYADRYPEQSAEQYRARAEEFLGQLENSLEDHGWIHAATMTVADMAVFPFVRQFFMVDPAWSRQSPYPFLRRWLEGILDSDRFKRVMVKKPVWEFGADGRKAARQ